MQGKKKDIALKEPEHSKPVPEEEYNPTEKDIESALGFDIRSLYHPQSKYSVAKKLEVVSAYLVTGNSKKAAAITKVPAGTIRYWKTTACWWQDAMNTSRLNLDSELEAGLYKGLRKGLELLNQHLEEGDDVLVEVHEYEEIISEAIYDKNEEGKRILVQPALKRKIKKNIFDKKAIPLKNAAVAWAVMWDKLQLAQGKPTSRTEKVDTPQEILKQLKTALEEESLQRQKDMKIVSDQ